MARNKNCQTVSKQITVYRKSNDSGSNSVWFVRRGSSVEGKHDGGGINQSPLQAWDTNTKHCFNYHVNQPFISLLTSTSPNQDL